MSQPESLTDEQQGKVLDECSNEIMDVLSKHNVHAVVYIGSIEDRPNNKFNLKGTALSTLKPTTYGQLNALIDHTQTHVSQVLAGLQQAVAEAEHREATPN